MKKPLLFVVGVMLLCLSSMAFAGDVTTIDFEQYSAYTQITNQYAGEGVLFTNALQLVAPFYDYFDYPPQSGSGVITNDPNDPIQVNFTGNVLDVSGWYADGDGVTVTAYSASNAVLDVFNGAAVLGSNDQFDVSSTTGPIAYVTISDVGGNADSETVDDLTFTVPEPGSLPLLGSGLLMAIGALRRKIKA